MDEQLQTRMNHVLRELTERYGRYGYTGSGRAHLYGLVPGDDDLTFAAAHELAAVGALTESTMSVALTPPMRLMLMCPALVAGWRRTIADIGTVADRREALDEARAELQALVAWRCTHPDDDTDLEEGAAMAAAVLVVKDLDPDAASYARAVRWPARTKLERLVPALDDPPGEAGRVQALLHGAPVDESWLRLQELRREVALTGAMATGRPAERPTWRGVAGARHTGTGRCTLPCCRDR